MHCNVRNRFGDCSIRIFSIQYDWEKCDVNIIADILGELKTMPTSR